MINMRIIITFIICLNINVTFSLSYSEITMKREDYFTLFIDTMVRVTQQCFNDKNGPVILAGNWSDINFNSNISNFSDIALVGSSVDQRKPNYYTRNRNIFKLELIEVLSKPSPANLFLIYEANSSALSLLFDEIRKSTWWNGRGTFFLGSGIDSCSNARYFLRIAFDFNIINAVFSCATADNGIELYTLNPYNQNAPSEWDFVDIHEEKKGHLSTLFKRSYRRDESICQSLIFDKTRSLKTYPVLLCVTPWPKIAPLDLKSPYKISGISVIAIRSIFEKLEAPIHVNLNESRGIIDNNGIPNDLLADILYGRCDMGMNIEYRRNLWRNEIELYESSGLCIVTRKEKITILEQVKQILTPAFLQQIALISITSTISFIIFFKQPWHVTVLDILRMMTSASAMYKPQLPSERFLFAWFVVLFMTFSSYIQSQLNALLTVPSYMPTVDTMDDLANSKHEIHADGYMIQFLNDPRMIPRLRDRGSLMKCIGRLNRAENVACLEDCMVIKYGINQSDLMHISRSSMFENYLTLLTHEDWPLFSRIDLMYKWILEAGIFISFRNQIEALNSRRNYYVDPESTRIFTLTELTYSFCYLAVGCLIATFAFFGEILLNYFGK